MRPGETCRDDVASCAHSERDGLPLASYVFLFRPGAVRARLEVLKAERAAPTPNVWQVSQGVARMWGRVLLRSETIGMSREHPVRETWRARLFRYRPLRFPFLLAERAVAPLDFSGLLSGRERIICHLLGAHHDGNQFAYDLQMLASFPGALEEVRRRTLEVLSERDPQRTAWLRDLVVYTGYHEALLAAAERALLLDFALPPHEADNPDISFDAYLRWCAVQPETPSGTLRAWAQRAKDHLAHRFASGSGSP